ncbi:putative transcription factor homeobox-WOX family [Lupinus albus]|uniref:Putative transcription factor homeobox-WOX family n=1 Tax=Lupinus albus TaxID=3870 RepID=A0A6A4NSC9_LUPAL|nr:putative transcription factor homeobox-WOX family [Lupinus albus]
METQQPNEDGGSGKGGFMSRQSSTRWTPTTDQIRILKDLYYNNGIRSPSAEQIQRISSRLRQYGKIEGKNVFYWFQNHKARERQKKRFTSDVPMQTAATPIAPASAWKHDEPPIHAKYSNISTGNITKYQPYLNSFFSFQVISLTHNNVPILFVGIGVSSTASSSAGIVTMGHMGNYGHGSVPMEKSFRDCSISAGGSSGHVGGAINNNLGYFGKDQYSSAYSLFEKTRASGETMEEEEEEEQVEDGSPEIQTLPLFPVHCEDIHGYCNLRSNSSNHVSSWYQTEDGFMNGSRASMELTLNSYTRKSPDYS